MRKDNPKFIPFIGCLVFIFALMFYAGYQGLQKVQKIEAQDKITAEYFKNNNKIPCEINYLKEIGNYKTISSTCIKPKSSPENFTLRLSNDAYQKIEESEIKNLKYKFSYNNGKLTVINSDNGEILFKDSQVMSYVAN